MEVEQDQVWLVEPLKTTAMDLLVVLLLWRWAVDICVLPLSGTFPQSCINTYSQIEKGLLVSSSIRLQQVFL